MRLHGAFSIALLALVVAGCEEVVAPDITHQFVDVATGGDHSCAVSSQGEAFCWGRGTDGELGTGDTANSFTPRRVASDVVFKSITAGYAHTCALDQNGRAYCWGFNAYGQLGSAVSANARVPQPVDSNEQFSVISAGAYHTCAVTLDHRVLCWGYNRWGQSGGPLSQLAMKPAQVPGSLRARSVSAGTEHTCAVSTDSVVLCWGSNQYSQLGIGLDTLYSSAPVPVRTTLRFSMIDAGATHTCGVGTDQVPYCWGTDWYGELGDFVIFIPGMTGLSTPGHVALIDRVSIVSAGVGQSCAVDPDAGALCWGRATEGQGGTPLLRNNAVRQPVTGGVAPFFFSVLATGGTTHACGIDTGVVYCWGTGKLGQLGSGVAYSSTPMRIGH